MSAKAKLKKEENNKPLTPAAKNACHKKLRCGWPSFEGSALAFAVRDAAAVGYSSFCQLSNAQFVEFQKKIDQIISQ